MRLGTFFPHCESTQSLKAQFTTKITKGDFTAHEKTQYRFGNFYFTPF